MCFTQVLMFPSFLLNTSPVTGPCKEYLMACNVQVNCPLNLANRVNIWLKSIDPEGQIDTFQPYIAPLPLNVWGKDLHEQFAPHTIFLPSSLSDSQSRGHTFLMGATEVQSPPSFHIQWKIQNHVWTLQWLLNHVKLKMLVDLVKKQLKLGLRTHFQNGILIVLYKKVGQSTVANWPKEYLLYYYFYRHLATWL